MGTSRTGTTEYKAWRKQALRDGQRNGIDHCPNCSVLLDYEKGKRPNSAEPDHIVPWSLGGRNTRDNARILCRRCNQSRGNGTKTKTKRQAGTVNSIDFTAAPATPRRQRRQQAGEGTPHPRPLRPPVA